MSTRIRDHIRSNLYGFIAIFIALSGTAFAVNGPLPGKNQVGSKDIINGEVQNKDLAADAITSEKLANDAVTNPKLADDAVGSAEVAPNSLGGGDVNEGSLSQVPSATLGGYGRSFSGAGCNPSSTTYIDCGYVTLNLPSPTRVLLNVVTRSYTPGGSVQFGFCRLVTSNGVLSGTTMGAYARDSLGLTTITGVIGPGSVDFGLECNESGADIAYEEVMISAVALSAS